MYCVTITMRVTFIIHYLILNLMVNLREFLYPMEVCLLLIIIMYLMRLGVIVDEVSIWFIAGFYMAALGALVFFVWQIALFIKIAIWSRQDPENKVEFFRIV